MPGIDLGAEALTYALDELNSYPERIGVTVFCQMATAPSRGNGAKTGPVPVWHLVLTMTNPGAVTGPKLRAPYVTGIGEPNPADIRQLVADGVAALRELGRRNLADAQRGMTTKPSDGAGDPVQ